MISVRSNCPIAGGVDTEIGLQRNGHVHTLGNVHKRATGPGSRIQRRELIVARGHALAEVLLKDLGVFAQTRVRVGEDDPLALEVFLDLLVDDLGLVLGGDTRDQAGLLRLGNTQTVVVSRISSGKSSQSLTWRSVGRT